MRAARGMDSCALKGTREMKTHVALLLIRAANALVTLASKLTAKPSKPEPVVLRDDMSDEDWLAMADGEILSVALRGISDEVKA